MGREIEIILLLCEKFIGKIKWNNFHLYNFLMPILSNVLCVGAEGVHVLEG
jgi:hypothetical protein